MTRGDFNRRIEELEYRTRSTWVQKHPDFWKWALVVIAVMQTVQAWVVLK